MSDMMRGGMGGGMGGGTPGGMAGKVQGQMSPLNPTDAATMKQNGQVTPDMKIKDYLAMMGIDVEGPLSQLGGAFKQQMGKANPMNKMQAFAGPGRNARQPQEEPSMDNLLRSM